MNRKCSLYSRNQYWIQIWKVLTSQIAGDKGGVYRVNSMTCIICNICTVCMACVVRTFLHVKFYIEKKKKSKNPGYQNKHVERWNEERYGSTQVMLSLQYV